MFSKNDVIELEITGMTHEGMGVGKKTGLLYSFRVQLMVKK